MLRSQSNEKETFSEILEASARETNDILSQRRKVMGQAWDDIDEGWQALQEHMTEVGITKPLDSKEGMVMLNVGGSRLTFHRSVLEGKEEQQGSTWALGTLCEAEWDKRVPRDSDGRIVLDESPACVKHLVHALLPRPASAKGMVAREERDLAPDEKPELLHYTARVLGLPGQSDGPIVLDESPIYVKHLVHALLPRPASAKGMVAREERDLAPDEKPELLHYTAPVLGLPGQSAPIDMSITGGTTILEPHETKRLTALVQGWCPGHPGGLELLYRASRDGWSARSFDDKCRDGSPSTITFLRVKGRATGGKDSIMGGFSSVPLTSPRYFEGYAASPGAFVFMLKDGDISTRRRGSASFLFDKILPSDQSAKWGVKVGEAANAVYRGPACGPIFGRGSDLRVVWKGGAATTVQTKNLTYDVPAESRFLSLNGRGVVDIETFRVCYCRPTDTLSSAKPKHHSIGGIAVPTAPVRSTEDVLSFGRLIADALMEEEMVLQEARNELAVAEARTTACATALAAVYGLDVAKGRGEEDVVELSVRGTRVTTMRSTLRICPGSALATQFLEDRWPATKKDLDDNGRRVIDCKPSVFSKVMDILRIAKRASWARGDDDQEANETPRVTIKPCDRAEFEEFVDMYFKGCESFIMEYVESLGDEEAKR